MSFVCVADLSVRLDGKQVLDNLNLSIEQGQLTTLIGTSGCGKSTLLKVLTGLLDQDTGELTIAGETLNKAAQRRGRFGYMPQQDSLLPWRNLLDNLLLGAEISGNKNKQTFRQLTELLPLFGLEGRERDHPSTLSGGMRRRAALLRTWLSGKQLLLLDEPFTGLDTFTQRDLQQWLVKLHKELGTTIMFVTHDLDEAILLADKVLVFSSKGGQIVHSESINLKVRDQQALISEPFIEHKKKLLKVMNNTK